MNPSHYIYGRIVPNPRKAPAHIQEVLANAVAEHLKEHADDGMSLFVFGRRAVLSPRCMCTPSAPSTTRRRSLSPEVSTNAVACRQVASGVSSLATRRRPADFPIQ